MQLAKVDKLEIGQKSDKFKKHPLNGLKHLSFSLYYHRADGTYTTLDLTCKDEYEFDFVVCALKALLFVQRGKTISKQELCRHSRIFRKHSDSGVPRVGVEKMLNFSIEYLEK